MEALQTALNPQSIPSFLDLFIKSMRARCEEVIVDTRRSALSVQYVPPYDSKAASYSDQNGLVGN